VNPEPLEAAVAMATAQVSFAREQPDDARLPNAAVRRYARDNRKLPSWL